MESLKPGSEKEKLSSSNTISDFTFSDLVDIADLQELINHFSELAGCPIGILDVNNNIIAAANWQKICTCFHRIHSETRDHCLESDDFIRQNLKTENPIAYKCKNGLWDVAYPIFIGGKHLANIFFGQFFFDDEILDLPYFEHQAQKYGFDKTEYLKSLNEVPVISRKRAETLKNFSATLAHMLAKTGYSNLLLKKEKIEELKITNQQLVESELKFRTLFEQAGVGVVQAETSTGRFLKVNKKFADMLGYTIEEMMQLTFLDFTHPDDIEESLLYKDKLINKKNEESSIDKRYIRKDGTIIWVRLTSTTMREIGEDNKFHISIVQDITDTKKVERVLKEDNERFHTTMNAIDSVIYVADLDNYEILFVNKYAKGLFGDITGKKCYSALQGKKSPCDFCTNHLLLDVNGNANQPYVWEFQNLITKRWYQCHDQAIQWTNGSLVRFEIATDITGNKENEQTLKKNEIKFRELNSTKDKLFSIIAHDLKNPFGVLLLASELLLKHLDKKDLTKVKSDVNMIYNASKRGYALLGNLLEWARSQMGNINFSPLYLHLRSTVSESIEIVEYQAKNKNITITNDVPDDFYIIADKNLLNIVFSNLLTNAIKFTYNNGSITIKAHTMGNMVEVSVVDTGIGIPKEDQDKLFRLDTNFSRKGTANEVSTGLGLILCKEFIEKHNGKIWVESESDKGSSFRFTLPYIQLERNLN